MTSSSVVELQRILQILRAAVVGGGNKLVDNGVWAIVRPGNTAGPRPAVKCTHVESACDVDGNDAMTL